MSDSIEVLFFLKRTSNESTFKYLNNSVLLNPVNVLAMESNCRVLTRIRVEYCHISV